MGYTLNCAAVWRSFDQLLEGLLLSLGLAFVSILIGAAIGLIVAFALLPWAGFAVRAFGITPSIPQRLAVGAGAVLMLFVLAVVELTFFRRLFTAELAQPNDRIAAWTTLGLLLYAAILPVFRARRDPRD